MTGGAPRERVRREALARFLRQRAEMAGPELFLVHGTRSELVAAVAAMAAPPAGRGSSPGIASSAVEEPRSGGAMSSAAPPAQPGREAVAVSGKRREAAARGPGQDVETSRGGAVELPALELPDRYEELRELALACERCALSEGRTNVVFGDGNPNARLVVVGEAPGANEDRTGLPFVGQAGKLLDLLLASVDLSRRDSVYICNVIKCRPPGNRNPRAEEIEACAPFLRRQIEIVSPEVVLAVGTFAAQLLTGEKAPLGRLRGRRFRYGDVPLIVTYHPAALLRNPGWTRPTWDDLQLLRSILDGD